MIEHRSTNVDGFATIRVTTSERDKDAAELSYQFDSMEETEYEENAVKVDFVDQILG